MSKITLLSKRFDELERQLAEVAATEQTHYSEWSGRSQIVDSEKLLNWQVKARHLLLLACGADSEHMKEFSNREKGHFSSSNAGVLKDLKAIFLAAREDYEAGLCISIKSIIQSELFENELEQSTELLRTGYVTAAAVIAGVVLETHIRTLCNERDIQIGKLDKMNSDLAKANVYNLSVQKRITAIADIRNKAAHGRTTEFVESDVVDMISYIQRFLSDYP